MLSNLQIILEKKVLKFLISKSNTIFLFKSPNIVLGCHNLHHLLQQQNQDMCLTTTKMLVLTYKPLIYWSLSQTPFIPQR